MSAENTAPNSNSPPSASASDSSRTPTQLTPTIFRRWVFCCLASVIICPLVSVMIGLHLHARDFSYPDEVSSPFSGRTIQMEVVLIAADPMAGMITMDWTIIGEEQSECVVGANNFSACGDVNIYFDNNLLTNKDPGTVRASSRPSTPIFRFNATAKAARDIVANTPTFRTELALFSPGNAKSSLLYYPFDQYSAEICMFAQDANTNTSLGIRIAKTRGIAVGFKTSAITRPDVYIPPGLIDIIVNLKRGNLVLAYVIVATIAIWLITAVLLIVMITSVFFSFRQKGEVLVIPVATLFAFTQLRQTMPGAPAGFGDIIDFVGILPCLALLSVSAAFILGAYVLNDPTEKGQRLNWNQRYVRFRKTTLDLTAGESQ